MGRGKQEGRKMDWRKEIGWHGARILREDTR